MRKKLSRYIGFPIKAVVTAAAIWYIYWKLRTQGIAVWHSVTDISPKAAGQLAAALALMPINWGLEAQKWLWMVRKFYPNERFSTSFQSVLAGISTGIFTPNRVGEYAGRILYLAEGRRVEAVVLLFIDRIYQMLVTLLMGTLALVLLILTYEQQIVQVVAARAPYFTAAYLHWTCAALFASNAITWWLAFSPKLVYHICTKIPLLLRYHTLVKAIDTLLFVDKIMLMRIFAVCVVRNAVFSAQYLLLMYAFGYGGDATLGLVLIWVIFLIKSVMPSIALSELGIREATAIFVMSIWHIAEPIALTSTFVLYVLNIILPAIVGLFFIYRIKLPISSDDSPH